MAHLFADADELFVDWGRGDAACGLDRCLDAFDGDHGLTASAADTARLEAWQRFKSLLEGEVGKVSLTGASPTFVCQSRREALEILAPRLTQLDKGSLSGQGNCFALLGPRGSGQTHFIKSLGRVVAHVARPTTCVIHVNMKSIGLREPLKLLQDALQDPRSGVELPADLRGPDVMMSSLLTFMCDSRRRALLLLDGVETMYTSDEESHQRVWRQLYSISEYDGRRPIMAVLTGSTAVLRALLYSIPGYGCSDPYNGYQRFSRFSDRKWVPITLEPIVAARDVRRAILCISSGIPAACVGELLCEGHLVAPPASSAGSDSACSAATAGGAGAILPPASSAHTASVDSGGCVGEAGSSGGSELQAAGWHVNLLAAGYGVSDEFVQFVSTRCRGLASWIKATLTDRSSRTDKSYHVERLLGETRRWEPQLRRLLRAWLRHDRDAPKTGFGARLSMGFRVPRPAPTGAGALAAGTAAVVFDERICQFGMPLPADERIAPWLQLMSSGSAAVSGSSASGFFVHFLHPSDVSTLLAQFPDDADLDGPAGPAPRCNCPVCSYKWDL